MVDDGVMSKVPESPFEPFGLTEGLKTLQIPLVIDSGQNICATERQGNQDNNSISFSNFLFD